jgi:hypothetical protein
VCDDDDQHEGMNERCIKKTALILVLPLDSFDDSNRVECVVYVYVYQMKTIAIDYLLFISFVLQTKNEPKQKH